MTAGEVEVLLSRMNEAPSYPHFNPLTISNKRIVFSALNGARVTVTLATQAGIKALLDYERKVARNGR